MAYKLVTDGEFTGWSYWDADPFDAETAGPFYARFGEDGAVAAYRIEQRHTRQGGIAHGGSLMTFADGALFVIAAGALGEDFLGLTVSFTCDFLAAAKTGSRVEARGDVVHAGKSLVFVRGIATADGIPVLNFSGTLKRTGA